MKTMLIFIFKRNFHLQIELRVFFGVFRKKKAIKIFFTFPFHFQLSTKKRTQMQNPKNPRKRGDVSLLFRWRWEKSRKSKVEKRRKNEKCLEKKSLKKLIQLQLERTENFLKILSLIFPVIRV